MLRIDITPYREGVHHVALAPEAQALDLDPEEFADLDVDVVLEVFNDRILVTVQASAVATLQCDRTLVSYDQPIEGTYRLLFLTPSFTDQAQDDKAGYEEVRVLQPTDRTIDLTEAVRDTLVLALPARKVAPGSEDLAIPTVFGEPDEHTIDPRWEALRHLREGGGSS